MTAHVSQALESALLLECKSLQARLSKRVDAAIFLTPVDPERDQCPDYLNLIAHPMDLGTVAARLAAGHYHTRSGIGAHLWFADVKRTFDNAMAYNPASHPVHRQAQKLQTACGEGYCSVLSRAEATLRRFAQTERWRVVWACILAQLVAHPHAWPFLEPVDIVALDIPDYPEIIKKPMDLGTIAAGLASMKYHSGEEVEADINLVFDNAIKYNPPGHPIHMQAAGLARQVTEYKAPVSRLLAPSPLPSSSP